MLKALIVSSLLLFSISSVVPLDWRDDPSSDSWEIVVSWELYAQYTWYDARDICMSEGGDLLFDFEIDNVTRHIFTSQHEGRMFWTGINRLRNFSKWEWGRQEPVPTSFPIKYVQSDEKCVAIYRQINSTGSERIALWSMNCGEGLYRFVCKRKKGESTPLVLPPPIVANTNCPEGWQDAGTSRCYKVFEHPDKIEWKEAMEACTSLPYYDPNLACANTPEEIDVLTRLVTCTYPDPASFWFGLIVEDFLDPWRWADSTRFTKNVINFHRYLELRNPHHPWDILDFKTYGMVVDNRAIPKGAWNFMNGTTPLRGFICQIKKDPIYNHTMWPSFIHGECPEGWRDPGTHRCYKVFEYPTKFSWYAARRACQRLPYYKPDLACVNSTAEIDVLARLVTSANHARFWFGFLTRKLYPAKIDGIWADGQKFDPKYSNFHRYFFHPRRVHSNGVIDNTGAWDLASYGFHTKWYICQIEKDPPYNYTNNLRDRHYEYDYYD